MRPQTTSATLLARLSGEDDPEAWRDFDARYGDLIVRLCCRSGLQHSDAEDVRQLVMLRFTRTMGSFVYDPRRGRFRAYLQRVVRNEIARKMGRPSSSLERVEVLEEKTAGSSGLETTDEEWDREWMHHHLRRAMARLRPSYDPRSVLIFERLLEGDAVKDVAQAFDTTEQAVHKVKQRIREMLKRIIATQVREEEEFGG